MKYRGHGGKEIVERVTPPSEVKKRIKGLKRVATGRIARECVDIAYGLGKAAVEAVCQKMTLLNGTLWWAII